MIPYCGPHDKKTRQVDLWRARWLFFLMTSLALLLVIWSRANTGHPHIMTSATTGFMSHLQGNSSRVLPDTKIKRLTSDSSLQTLSRRATANRDIDTGSVLVPPIETGSVLMPSSESSCQVQLKLSDTKLPLVALASAPGSGNTWVRHLLQLATGIYTSSVQADGLLLNSDEFLHKRLLNGSASPIKTHLRSDDDRMPVKYDKAILILRNPYDAIRAEYNREHAGKTGHVTPARFQLHEWRDFVKKCPTKWLNQVVSWMLYEGPLFLMKFDALKLNLIDNMREVVYFLEMTTTTELLSCVEKNQEGSFHRDKIPIEEEVLVFDENIKISIENAMSHVQWFTSRRCPKPPFCLPFNQANLTSPPYILPKSRKR